jgi:hypothetical protein
METHQIRRGKNMKRVFMATCLATLCAVGLGAQTQADDQKQKGADQAKAAEKAVTITGCLRAGDTPNSFVLANVKTDEPKTSSLPDPAPSTPPSPPTPPPPPTDPPSTPPSNPPSTPPTPPTPPDPATPPAAEPVGTSGAGDVVLVGAPASVDLAKHIGHTVSITGTFVPAAKGSKPTGTSGAAGAADVRSFNVKAMKHISETCK